MSLLAQPALCSCGMGIPTPSKTFPFNLLFIISPFNSILESRFRPADGPIVLPPISPKSRLWLCPYSRLCPEPRGLTGSPSITPLPKAEIQPPPLPPPRAGNKPQPWAAEHPPPPLPTPPQNRDPSAWGFRAGCGPSCAVGPMIRGGAGAGKQTLSILGCKHPWTWPPPTGAPSPAQPWRGGPMGTDARDSSVASWAPFPPGCAGQASPLTENRAGGEDSLNTEVWPGP